MRKVLNLSRRHFILFTESMSVSSISNEMDPDGKTKILTILNIKFSHQHEHRQLASQSWWHDSEANILPLDSFRTMFPHALVWAWLPHSKDSWKDPRSTLNVAINGRLINHGCIKLKLQYYSEKSFQDHYFYVLETKTSKRNHCWTPSASIRLGLIHVYYAQNVPKSISAIENSRKYQLEQLLSRPSTKYLWQTMTEEAEK